MTESRNRYAVFWGCAVAYRVPWIEVAARRVLPELGVEIVDLPFSCCPDPVASKAVHHMTWLSLAARNLALAEERGLDILTLCSGCFGTLKMAEHELREKSKRERVNAVMRKVKREYRGSSRVRHLMEWMYDEIGVEALKSRVRHPISLRAATHTGCHFMRPSDILQTDHPTYPERLDELSGAIGLESVDYPDKNLCCGVGAGLVDRNIPRDLVRRKHRGANRAGAEIFVAHCPSCILSYDDPGIDGGLPVFHYLELLGLAFGIGSEQLALGEHRIPVPEGL